MNEPLFLKPALHHKIWGGTALKDRFGFDIPSETTGEAWVISGHKNGPDVIENGQFAGQTLAQLWEEQAQLFGNTKEKRPFPLLVKILDAHADLSVQVHPDDDYAGEHAGELGKTESWYVIDAAPGAEIYYGHHAQTKEEFDTAIDQGDWDKLLRKVPVKAGDFFYVPSGTLHALGAGVLVLETQQSSDVTYRVYDFDRPDPMTGELRELHLSDAKAVTEVPFKPEIITPKVKSVENARLTTLAEVDYFNVFKWDVAGEANFEAQAPYTLGTVIAGQGSLSIGDTVYTLLPGTSFLLPSDVATWTISGNLTLIASTPGPLSL